MKAAKRVLRPTKGAYDSDHGQVFIAAWHTSHRVTMYLVENLPPELWSQSVPGAPRRTLGMIVAHLHNARCMWIKMLGARHGIGVPRTVDGRTARPAEVVRALTRSSEGIVRLIELGMARGGVVPRAAWQNFPTDLAHFLAYFVAHEAHHRGQLVLLARQCGHRLPPGVTAGLWQWNRRARE
jgi:uncharacterized damage-inducible protein DinB